MCVRVCVPLMSPTDARLYDNKDFQLPESYYPVNSLIHLFFYHSVIFKRGNQRRTVIAWLFQRWGEIRMVCVRVNTKPCVWHIISLPFFTSFFLLVAVFIYVYVSMLACVCMLSVWVYRSERYWSPRFLWTCKTCTFVWVFINAQQQAHSKRTVNRWCIPSQPTSSFAV